MLSTMLSTILTRKTEEYLAKRYEQGRVEALVEVEEWNRRRLAAEAKGEPFDEPLPSATERSAG